MEKKRIKHLLTLQEDNCETTLGVFSSRVKVVKALDEITDKDTSWAACTSRETVTIRLSKDKMTASRAGVPLVAIRASTEGPKPVITVKVRHLAERSFHTRRNTWQEDFEEMTTKAIGYMKSRLEGKDIILLIVNDSSWNSRRIFTQDCWNGCSSSRTYNITRIEEDTFIRQ